MVSMVRSWRGHGGGMGGAGGGDGGVRRWRGLASGGMTGACSFIHGLHGQVMAGSWRGHGGVMVGSWWGHGGVMVGAWWGHGGGMVEAWRGRGARVGGGRG